MPLLALLLTLAAARNLTVSDPDPHGIVGDLCAALGGSPAPATHVYRRRNGATVVFVAVTHAVDAATPAVRAAPLKQVADAIDRYRPDVVLVEGVSASRSEDPAYLAFLGDSAARAAAAGTIEENLYAVKIATERHLIVAGWDLSPHEEYVGDIAAGYAMTDALGAHLLRDRQNPLGAFSAAVVQRELASIPHLRQPTAFDFAGWYRTTYGDVYQRAAGTPCGSGIASRIVRDESVRRTLGIPAQLERFATPGRTVLVEAGSAHWAALRPYLEAGN